MTATTTPNASQSDLGVSPAKSWHRRALCPDHPAHWWTGTKKADNAKALAICLHCPVRVECELEHRGETIGVWHGVVKHRVRTG